MVFADDTTLNWATVYEASGVGEPRMYTWRKTSKKKKRAIKWSIIIGAAQQASKKGPSPGATSTSRGRGKGKEVQVDEETEFESSKSEEREELFNFEYEGEEEEGYTPLDKNEIKYVGIEEEPED